MKKLLVILLLLNLNLHAAEEGLLHQWRFDQAKNGAVAAKVGAPAKYSGSVNLETIGQATSTSASAFSSTTLSPTENYKRLITSDIVLRDAAQVRDRKALGIGQARPARGTSQ